MPTTDEKQQITSTALKGGFKADGNKARFDLFPEATLRLMLSDGLAGLNLSAAERDLFEMMLTYWYTPLDVDAVQSTLRGVIAKSRDVYVDDVNAFGTADGVKKAHPVNALDFAFAVGELFAIGANKYAARNWEKGMDFGRVWSAMLRHLLKFVRGERHDDVDGQHHMTSVAWCAVVLLHFESNRDTYREFDTRGVIERAEDKGQA